MVLPKVQKSFTKYAKESEMRKLARTKTNVKNVYYDKTRQMYYARLYYGVVDGKKKTEWETFKEKAEAKKRVMKFEADKVRQEVANPDKITLEQWLTEWYEDIVKVNNAITTQEGYSIIINKHLIPKLGKIPLQKLTSRQIQRYYKQKLTEDNGFKKNGEPYPPLATNTVKKHHTLLMTALGEAVQHGLLMKNPVESVRPPKYVKPKIAFYNIDSLIQLFDIVYDTPIEPAIYLAGTIALRREEICGLKWNCVQMDSKLIKIENVSVRAFNQIHTKSETKNATSTRLIAIPDELYEVLERHKARQYNNKELMGDAYNPINIEESYVVVNDLGYQINPATLSSTVQKTIRRNNLPPVSLRGLRHTVATVLNDAGTTLYDISKLLGHASTDITGRVYVEAFAPDNRKAIQTVSDLLSQAKNK